MERNVEAGSELGEPGRLPKGVGVRVGEDEKIVDVKYDSRVEKAPKGDEERFEEEVGDEGGLLNSHW